jgi:general secretion pathway protein G
MKIKPFGEQKWLAFYAFGLPIIVGVLAIIGSSASNELYKSRYFNTKTTCRETSRALISYQHDCGNFPSTEQGLEALLHAPPGAPNCRSWSGPYLKKLPTDAWSRPFTFRLIDGVGEVQSLARDAKPGGEGFDRDIICRTDDVE